MFNSASVDDAILQCEYWQKDKDCEAKNFYQTIKRFNSRVRWSGLVMIILSIRRLCSIDSYVLMFWIVWSPISDYMGWLTFLLSFKFLYDNNLVLFLLLVSRTVVPLVDVFTIKWSCYSKLNYCQLAHLLLEIARQIVVLFLSTWCLHCLGLKLIGKLLMFWELVNLAILMMLDQFWAFGGLINIAFIFKIEFINSFEI